MAAHSIKLFSRSINRVIGLFVLIVLTLSVAAGTASAQTRSLGVDVSAWQGNWAQSVWDNFRSASDGDERVFAFIRSSRGGTTGYYNQSDSDNSDGLNTLSQRYDDPYFIQNITRSTKAGIFSGAYHFNRADIIESTLNSNGIRNTGADEATHFMQMASPWMRPGYMLPVLDLEAGASQHSTTSLSNWAVEFSNTIYQQMGIHPIVYVNSSYANSEVNSSVAASMPNLWIARPTSGDPLTSEPPPASGYPNVYGVWNPSYPNTPTPAPWKFWQYNTSGGIPGYSGNLDKDAANGGIEFVKDYLVPAVWMNDSDGEWTTLSNWNSGVEPVQPVQGPGQVGRVGGNWTTSVGGTPAARPNPRLPGEDDTPRNVDGQNDTVILDRPNANITITLSSGNHNIRKLYAREALNITGGSLTVNYAPSADSTPFSAQFSAPVSLSGGAGFSVHTLQVDAANVFTLAGGTLTANKINLMPHASNPAKLLLGGDVTFNPLNDASSSIAVGSGTGSTGFVDLGGGMRTLTVGDASPATDLTISVPVTNGGFHKAGAGTLRLTGANTYAGDTIVDGGSLRIYSPFLSNTADVYLAAGGVLDLNFGTATDIVDSLFIDGVMQAAGIWGAVGSGAQYTSTLISGNGFLQVMTAPPISIAGDFDNDGDVDGDDLTIWQGAYGTGLDGDADEDGDTDGHDLFIWQQNYTGPGALQASSTTIPEPTSIMLLVAAAIASLSLTRR